MDRNSVARNKCGEEVSWDGDEVMDKEWKQILMSQNMRAWWGEEDYKKQELLKKRERIEKSIVSMIGKRGN